MRRTVLAALSAALLLAGCGAMRESRLNPFNWFGRSAARDTMVTTATPSDPRALVAQVLDMKVEAYPGGAIVRATGLTPTQGWWDAELVARDVDENGVLVFDFRIFPPVTDTAVNNQQSRQVTAAASLSDIKLDGVREIVVQGESNARSSRR
jgi:hypothetical protein